MPLLTKPACHAACLTAVQARLDLARAGMAAAQESSNSETKSSAGDKYETGREMANQERDRQASQLLEAQQQLADLRKLQPELPCATVRLGALVTTSLGAFYVSVAAGRLRTAEGQEFAAVSSAAPLMQALAGQQAGASVAFNGRPVRIEAVA